MDKFAKNNNRKTIAVDARNKALSIIMSIVLVFTMIPVASFSYINEANADIVTGQTDSSESARLNEDGDVTEQNATGGESSNVGQKENSQQEDETDSGSSVGGPSEADQQAGANSASEPSNSTSIEENRDTSSDQSEGDNSASDESVTDSADTQLPVDNNNVRDAREWQSDLEHCVVDGSIAINADKIDSLEEGCLPVTIPLTLSLSFDLNFDEELLAVGDTIKLVLPSFISVENGQLDVYRSNEDGTKTDEVIAKATVDAGKLTIVFNEDASAYVQNESDKGSQASLKGALDIAGSCASSLLGQEESDQSWVVQAGENNAQRVIKLALPTYQSVVDAWNNTHGIMGLFGLANGTVEAYSDSSDGEAASKVTITPGSFNTQIASSIIWCDNNYGSRPSPESLQKGFIPQFSLNETDYYDLISSDGAVTEDAINLLHLNANQISSIEGAYQSNRLIDISRTAVNTYEVLSMALPSQLVTTTKTPVLEDGQPTYDEDGNQVFNTETENTPISWKLNDTNSYSTDEYNYIDGSSSTWKCQYKMLTSEVTFHVVGKTGGVALQDIFGSDEADDFRFIANIDGADEGDTSIAQAVLDGWLNIESEGSNATITGRLPSYNQDGYPIVYRIEYTGEQSGLDYYQVSYDNSASPSHGSAVNAAYENGTMTLRHAGTTTYSATKEWLDNDSSQRPEVTYTLWRYATDQSYATAAQVSLSSLDDQASPVVPTNATQYVQVAIPAGSNQNSVNLYDLLKAKYGTAVDSLPKYDPDGYPYIYALREEPVSGYEQVFGSVDEKGNVSDTNPNYQDSTGQTITVEGYNRNDSDRFIYNDGTISNRITGTTQVSMTKTWKIAAFQDSLKDVQCEFTAQSRPKGSSNDAEWKDVTASSGKQTLNGWNAETLTKTISETFPKYDSWGNELEYRWIESGVTLEGQDTHFNKNTGEFTIDVNVGEGVSETLNFTSTPETTTDSDGNTTTVITNSFNNETDQHVDKLWEQLDGSYAQIAPDPGRSDGIARLELYQDGILVGEFTLDGKVDSQPTTINNLNGATWSETSSYHGDFEHLPKYSEEGTRYSYLVIEKSMAGWKSTRTYNPDSRTTTITNDWVGEGEGSEIRVTKKWLDGDDAEHRLKVKVNLVASRYIQAKTNTDSVTGELLDYDAGEVVVEDIILSEENQWFTEVTVGIGDLTYKDFYVEETALIAEDGTEYPVVTKDEAAANEEYKNEAWVNAGWSNPDNKRVATPEHVYEAKYQYNDTLQSCEATNRRLGLLNINITKQWNDTLGNIEDEEESPRPEAALTVSCLENDNAFSLNAEGYLQVSVSGNTLPVTDTQGNSIQAEIVNDDDKDGKGDARIEVNTQNGSSTYSFCGLPKYDSNGLNVHYTVEESWVDPSNVGDYHSSKTKDTYEVKPNMRHFQDVQTVEFSNTRSGVRDVTFYKEWHDNYVSETLNQRPDIYLTLWQVSGTNAPKTVDGYVHYLWQPSQNDGDASKNQKVVFSNLSKYDNQGYEITYYATESMSADGASLGYGPVTFSYDNIETSDDLDEPKNAIKVEEDSVSDDPTSDGTGWAIREDGTFVNRLVGTLTAQGTKLWENTPGNVGQEDLPEITVYLQQKLASDTEWPVVKATSKDNVSGVIASSSDLKKDENNQYSYTIDKDSNGEPLPRYNEDGELYEYRAIEIAWGLLDQPGGFTMEQISQIEDLGNLEDPDVKELMGNIYTVQHGETGSFLIRNVYGGSAKGNLTVKKLFAGRDATDVYPEVTFDVYRYYQTSDGINISMSDAERVASYTISQDEFKQSTEGSEGNHSATHTFKDLDIYAPDGSRWIYYVVEHSINGYTTTVASLDIADANDTQLVSGDEVEGGVRSSDLGSSEETVIDSDENVDVTFANEYKPDSVGLNGQKEWIDYNNIFSVRPDKNDFELTFERYADGIAAESVEVQSANPDEPNYLAWDNDISSNIWSFTLSNVEKWAPNGKAWTYKVTEDLEASGIASYYTAVSGSSSISADNESGVLKLENALSGKASVVKNWDDGGDPYGLRPLQVTVELQARYAKCDNLSNPENLQWSDWGNAYDVLDDFASDSALEAAGFSKDNTSRILTSQQGWRGSWQQLPIIARQTADSSLNVIQYRVVESAIGTGDEPVVVESPDDNGVYSKSYFSYQPSQTTEGNAANGWSTSITNTLQGAEISATKTWKGDALENLSDAWGTRPSNGDTWTATFFLQHKVGENGNWEWVVEEGSDANPSGSALQDGVVSLTISESDSNSDTSTVSWDNLPKTDADGNIYSYRVVEQVPGSYDVVGGEKVEDSDTDHRYYVVASSNDAQSFINSLRTVDLTGTKSWDSEASNLVPSNDADIQMTLYRAVKNSDGSFGSTEKVMLKDGSAPNPEWTINKEGTWTFTYSNLPAANKDNVDYVYWAEEQQGSVDGFYPTYDQLGATGTSVESGTQQNTTITNNPTRLSLSKVDDNGNPLANITLSIQSSDGSKTYAIWENGQNGETYKTYTWVNGTANPAEKDEATVRDENLIVGLAAGNYKVVETGNVPEGYAKAQDVSFTIQPDGTATSASGVETKTEKGIHTIQVTAVDPILRGHLFFTKYVTDDGTNTGANKTALENATFDLYQKNSDPSGEDLCVATGLTTDEKGAIATKGNGTSVTDAFKEKYDSKYTTLSDGLPEGNYYFLETDATPGAVMPAGEAMKSQLMTITQENHFAYTNQSVTSSMANEDFSSTVKLHKYDEVTNQGIQGIKFSLTYTPSSSNEAFQGWTKEVATENDGTLILSGLEKGTYTLTEKDTQTGYISKGFSATFTINDDDDDATYDIRTTDRSNPDVVAIDFKVTSGEGTFVDSKGIPNEPQRGSVTLAKTGQNNTTLNGVTFTLEKMNGSDWSTLQPTIIAEGLVTGLTYSMNDDGTALENAEGILGTNGYVTVRNLPWGTYRFVETAPAAGYIGAQSDGSAIVSSDLVISRTSLDPSLTGSNALSNSPTSLEINKQNDVGEALDGAEFQITAVDDSQFANPGAFATGTYNNDTKTVTLSTVDGQILLTGQLVVGGTYTVYESKAPTGYDPADGKLTVTVQNDGSLDVQGDMPDRYAWTDLDEDGQADSANSFMVTNIHEEIELLKVSSADEETPLAGAEFTLTGLCMDNNTTHTYTTDDEGRLLIDAGLRSGVDYTLYESQPASGYTLLEGQLKFHMNERGEIVVDGDVPEGFTVNDDKISLRVEDDPVNLQITKRASAADDDTEGELLDGAAFTITPVEGSTFADGSTESIKLVTGENGTALSSAQLVVGGTYDITEMAAPEGYEKVEGTMRVTVDDNGTIRVLGSVQEDGTVNPQKPTGYSRVDDNSFEVQVVNVPVEISLVKVNADNTTSRLEGGEFQITGIFAKGTAEETRIFTTASDGTLLYNGDELQNMSALFVAGRDYTITETKAPDGFELIEGSWTFQITESGELRSDNDNQASNGASGFAIGVDNVTIIASDKPIEIGFVKKDLGDTTLTGAEYTLSGVFVNDTTHETAELDIPFTSTEEMVSFAKLSYGDATYSLVAGQSYTLTENTAPSHYETLEPFTFSVDENGKIVAADGFAQAGSGEEGYVISETDGNIVLTAHDTPIGVMLHKTSSADKQLALAGAVFELYEGHSAQGEPYGKVVTDEDGLAKIENLIAGTTYTLHEVTAPEGYELLADVTFTVTKDGTVEFEGGHQGYTAEEDENGVVTLAAADTHIEAQLVKTDEEGMPLAGAVFTITGKFANSAADKEERVLGPTDSEGVVVIPSAELVAGNTYTVTEITAPDGFELAGSVELTVGADGVITLTETTDEAPTVAGTEGTGTYTASAVNGIAVITATDHPIELTITKTDGGEGLLPGAEFTATSSSMSEETSELQVVTATTGEDGTAVLKGLIAGKQYTLTETKAPAGYKLLTDELAFTVNTDGTIDAGIISSGSFQIGSSGDAVTVIDNPLEVSLVKQAPNGAPLAGAEFLVEGAFPDGSNSKTFTSDENGIVFDRMQMIGSAEGTAYTVKETKAPEGYALPEGTLTLVVFEDGTVVVGGDSSTDLKRNTSVSDKMGIAIVSLSNDPLPETSLPKTGDQMMPVVINILGILGIVAGVLVVGSARLRRKNPGSSACK